jgi:predicted lipid-binding transport protein (Tim44 family)
MLNKILAMSLLAFASSALLISDVDARRLGGGRSFGAQRNVAPEPSRPANQQAPTNANAAQAPSGPDAASAPRPQTPAPAAAPSAGSRWLAPLAGIAAGLGLAALLSHFGMSGDFSGLLLLALFIGAAVLILRRVFARPSPAPLQYASATNAYTPGSIAPQQIGGPMPAEPGAAVPSDFDTERFLAQARVGFNQLQAAFDKGDRRMLADMMTPEMYDEVSRDLQTGRNEHPTEVVKLDTQVIEVTTEGDRHWASVHFSGLLREDGKPLPTEFDEVWHLTKPVDGSHGWLLAGIQQTREAVH